MRRSHRVLLGLILAAATVASPARAQDAADGDADRAQQIHAILRTVHGHGLFNGSALVARHGRVIYKRGFGWANVEWDIPNGPDTRFRLASVTKQFTAVVVLQLVEAGLLDLEGTIVDYLPDYRADVGSRVTIHQLLNHTSGIPSYTSLPGFYREVSRDPYPVDRFVAEFCSGPLQFEPGTQFRYNNSGYFLLGSIIEAVTGRTYETVVQERIFRPLGMRGSGYDRHSDVIPRRAAGYQVFLGEMENAPYLDMSLPFAAGALYSTVEDLHRWDRGLHGGTLLSAESREKMHTAGLGGYGYGFHVEPYTRGPGGAPGTMALHAGGIQGFSTLIVRLLEDEHLIVLLCNSDRAPLTQLARQIANVLYDMPVELPPPPVSDLFFRKLIARGVDEALVEYRELWEKRTAPDIPTEAHINQMGYALLGRGRIDDAITVFRFNVAAYPESWNVHDSLGEGYLAARERDLAIASYRRSLVINPDNENGKRMLRGIGADPDAAPDPADGDS
jgi:CubicO group peptidase (beta-lactamase class C family)